MTASEWKQKSRAAAEVVDLTLPSGMVIQARRPDPMQYALWNRLPLLFAETVEGPANPARVEEIAAAMRELLLYCCVSPGVSLTPGPDEIHPREICDKDFQFILRWAMRMEEVERFRPFRGKPGNGVGGDNGETVLTETFEPVGYSGPDGGSGVRPGGGGEVLPISAAGKGRG